MPRSANTIEPESEFRVTEKNVELKARDGIERPVVADVAFVPGFGSVAQD